MDEAFGATSGCAYDEAIGFGAAAKGKRDEDHSE